MGRESRSQGVGYSIVKEPWAVSPNTLRRERSVPASFVVGALRVFFYF
jgi:hypothetical protein